MIKLFKILLLVFFLISSPALTQNKNEAFLQQGNILMNAGRYSEAIDQINKFIAANPRLAVGYHKRGLCYEQRTEYQYSVLDLRRARNLDPTNSIIQKDLSRVIAVWHKLLYQKIEGHKRDIAVDPKIPWPYLEIGKSYRWLEEWSNAEFWYDEYLKRDDNASPDEIIRYTEILAKTGSIVKGEKILKKYTERYPEDWRIWSRYGYFVMWLGKYKLAENAFKTSLGFKPFFKEAEDGLDLAKREGYLTQYQPRSYERVEYPIDRYYILLEKNPELDQVRFDLINELIAAHRIEEAYQQLLNLQPKHSEEENFKTLLKNVTSYRDSTFTNNVENYTSILKNDPSNKEVVLKLSEAYANLLYYDSAIEVINEYLTNIPQDKDFDIRYKFAQYSAWNYEWEKAISQIEELLKYDPNNLDYQLLRAQIAVWTVHDLDVAEKYLLNVIDVRPKELSALISLISLYSWQRKFSEAKKYLDMAQSISPNNSEVISAQSNYELHYTAYQEILLFAMKEKAAKLATDNNCPEALIIYEDYTSKRTGLTKDEMIEYAQIATCAKEFSKAIEMYDKILNDQFDYDIALQRAKNYYYNHDSTKALEELEKLSKIKPDDDNARIILADCYTSTQQPEKAELIYRDLLTKPQDESQREQLNQRFVYLAESYIKNNQLSKASEILDELEKSQLNPSLLKDIYDRRLYLGDAYVMDKNFSEAGNIYKDLLNVTTDTTQLRIIRERISWLPPSGFSRGIANVGNFLSLFLPTNIGLSPFSTFYKDNQSFQLFNYGMRLDAGFFGYLSLGGIWSRVNLNNSSINRNFTQLKGSASLFLADYLIISGSYGNLKFSDNSDKKIGDIILRSEKQNVYSIILSYEYNDVVMLLYSPTLLNTRLSINYYHFYGMSNLFNLMKLSLLYNYYNINDGNEGNDIQIRLGKNFLVNGTFGYEYFFSDCAFVSPLYYSPQNFESHSIWGEWNYQYQKWKFKVGGKLGYVPKVDYVLNEIFGEAIYNPLLNLNISCRLGYMNSYRYDSSYSSFSASIYAYWGIF